MAARDWLKITGLILGLGWSACAVHMNNMTSFNFSLWIGDFVLLPVYTPDSAHDVLRRRSYMQSRGRGHSRVFFSVRCNEARLTLGLANMLTIDRRHALFRRNRNRCQQ